MHDLTLDMNPTSPSVCRVRVRPMFDGGQAHTQKIDEALAGFRRFAAVLDRRLDGTPHVIGRGLIIADLTLASSLLYAKQTEAPPSEFPHIDAWFSRIRDMDAWKQTAPDAS